MEEIKTMVTEGICTCTLGSPTLEFLIIFFACIGFILCVMIVTFFVTGFLSMMSGDD